MSREKDATHTLFEQLELPISPQLLTWVWAEGGSLPQITGTNIRDYSRVRTGDTNLGTRIIGTIELALGYNPFYNPAPEGHDPEAVFEVLDAALEGSRDRPFWGLGKSSLELFQQYKVDVEAVLTAAK